MSMIVVRFPSPTHFRVRALEWLLAGVMITWAVILAQPDNSFANPSFATIARVANEETVALACLIIGLARLAALYVNGAWVPSPWVRLICALISAVFWLQIALGMAATDTATTGLAVYPWFVLCDLYSVWRAARDARMSREARLAQPEAPVMH
jgi:hypothetical protein